MHHLHTTPAFVLGCIEQGESNLTYRLLTQKFGLLYAHAQGVRELKSRNRFALKTGTLSIVTLVHGREFWRVTGAEERQRVEQDAGTALRARRIFDLLSKFLPVEDPVPEVYELLESGVEALHQVPVEDVSAVEVVTVLRILQQLGYVAQPNTLSDGAGSMLASAALTPDLLQVARKHEQELIGLINSALQGANS